MLETIKILNAVKAIVKYMKEIKRIWILNLLNTRNKQVYSINIYLYDYF